ncbi:MAG: hypothetical protein KJ964_02720 [Verrucomicrobia bacterium]|nr:hypothetical protein [Verrucomicrobiota bacterium]MBU1735266.1 hypothetical protein [Verrucomicrobiota bacterium]MBU1856481.1 hypothetical protein [Verrucomicrobiota bacterium]
MLSAHGGGLTTIGVSEFVSIILFAARGAPRTMRMMKHDNSRTVGGAKIHRIPELAGKWFQVAFSPDLPGIHSEPGEVVDHCFFKATNGRWQLWTQIRGTSVGRLFYRWEGSTAIETPDWAARGICWRAERRCGESWGTEDKDFVHAPYVLQHDSRFILYYGGGPSATGHSQICAAASDDGIHFRRLTDNQNQSQLFSGPGVARDPMVINTGKCYAMYYAANVGESGVIAVRTASRPYGTPWSDYRIASEGGVCGDLRWTQQCPFVVYLDGYYYLFKIGPSNGFRTAVYRSDDPLFFGAGDERLVTVLETSVSEIIQEAGRFYISSLIPGYKGVSIRRLHWVPSD